MLDFKHVQALQPLSQVYLGSSSRTVGYVERAISPTCRGRVRYRATSWFGICEDARSLPCGTEVTVLGRQGNTLIVKPVASDLV